MPTEHDRGLGREEHDEHGVHEEHRHQPLEAVAQRRRVRRRRLDVRRAEGEVRRGEGQPEHDRRDEAAEHQVAEAEVGHQHVDPLREQGVGRGEQRPEHDQSDGGPGHGAGDGRGATGATDHAETAPEPRQAAQGGERPGQPGHQEARQRPGARDPDQEHRPRGDRAQRHDRVVVEQHHRQHQQHAQAGADQRERLPPTAGGGERRRPGGEQDHRPREAGQGERHAARRPAPRRRPRGARPAGPREARARARSGGRGRRSPAATRSRVLTRRRDAGRARAWRAWRWPSRSPR